MARALGRALLLGGVLVGTGSVSMMGCSASSERRASSGNQAVGELQASWQGWTFGMVQVDPKCLAGNDPLAMAPADLAVCGGLDASKLPDSIVVTADPSSLDPAQGAASMLLVQTTPPDPSASAPATYLLFGLAQASTTGDPSASNSTQALSPRSIHTSGAAVAVAADAVPELLDMLGVGAAGAAIGPEAVVAGAVVGAAAVVYYAMSNTADPSATSSNTLSPGELFDGVTSYIMNALNGSASQSIAGSTATTGDPNECSVGRAVGDEGRGAGGGTGYFYLSTATLEQAGQPGPGVMATTLGSWSPMGAFGPLGYLGPVGVNLWNPSLAFKLASLVPGALDLTFKYGAALDEAGALGSQGVLAVLDSFPVFQGGGIYTVWGPIGPLGPMGVLGPLGPTGPYGTAVDSPTGQYIRNGVVVRTADVPYVGEIRTYELFEHYDASFASSMPDNDTSFMVESTFGNGDSYAFSSQRAGDQFVTVAVVPDNYFDDFDLEVSDGSGTPIAISNSYRYIDFVQLRVRPGQTLRATVVSNCGATFPYRLYVVGSTEYYAASENAAQPYLRSYAPH